MAKKKESPAHFLISQSFMKDVRDYIIGDLCGRIVEAKYVTRNYPDTQTDSMRIGSYFEYCLTGGKLRSGAIPQPEYMASKLTEKRKLVGNEKLTDHEIITKYSFGPEQMYEGYRTAYVRAQMVKQLWKDMNIEIVKVGRHVIEDNYEAHLDVEVLIEGEEATIDVKYSGLIDDQWSRHGWMWSDIQTRYHGTQGKHYTFLGKKPMYFCVVSSAKEFDMKFFRMVFSDRAIDNHLDEAKVLFERFEWDKKTGFNVYPEYKQCLSCALNSVCEYKKTAPSARNIEINE